MSTYETRIENAIASRQPGERLSRVDSSSGGGASTSTAAPSSDAGTTAKHLNRQHALAHWQSTGGLHGFAFHLQSQYVDAQAHTCTALRHPPQKIWVPTRQWKHPPLFIPTVAALKQLAEGQPGLQPGSGCAPTVELIEGSLAPSHASFVLAHTPAHRHTLLARWQCR